MDVSSSPPGGQPPRATAAGFSPASVTHRACGYSRNGSSGNAYRRATGHALNPAPRQARRASAAAGSGISSAGSVHGSGKKHGECARRSGERPAQEEPDGIYGEPAQAGDLAEQVELPRIESGEEHHFADAADDERPTEDQDGGFHGTSCTTRHSPRGSSTTARQCPA